MVLYLLVTGIILAVCVLLVLVVLVQNSKGGGLAPNFSGAGSLMGARQTTNVVEKATWTLATLLGVLCIVAVAVMPRANRGNTGSRIQEQLERTLNSAPQNAAPLLPGTGDAGTTEGLEDILVAPGDAATAPADAETPATEPQAGDQTPEK